jgi:hypothetical protein
MTAKNATTVVNRGRTGAFQIEEAAGMAEFGITLGKIDMITEEAVQVKAFFSYSELLKIKDAIEAAISAGTK